MKTSSVFKKWLSFFVWAVLPLIPLLIPAIAKHPLWPLIPGYLLWVLKLSFDHFDQVNLFFNKLILRITNREVVWGMSAEFSGNFSSEKLQDVYGSLLDFLPTAKTWRDEKDSKIVKLPMGGTLKIETLTVRDGEDDFTEILHFDLSDYVVPFNHSEKLLNQLIELIDKTIRSVVNAEREKYTFKVGFGEKNPYFGLFMKRLRLSEQGNIRFNISFKEKIGVNSGRVEVSTDKLVVVTKSLSSLQHFSSKYITLSSLNLPETS
jgi:hypothetical protein